MARDKGHLTDLQLRRWIKAGQPLAKADGDGLTFTFSAACATGWILRFRHGGRRRALTIGRYPDIGLAEARGIATLAARNGCEGWGRSLPGLWGRPGNGGQATGRGRAARGGGCRVRITSGRCRARARGWRQGRALARREGVDDDAATHMRWVLGVPASADTMVTRSRLQGLRSCDFGGSMLPRAAS